MKLKELLKNQNFMVESPCVVRLIDEQENTLGIWSTWDNNIPANIYESYICWITSYASEDFPGCDSAVQIDVMNN